MIAALVLAAQSIVTGAPPIDDPRPATTWSCQFAGINGASFALNGYFAEAPLGSDPNVSKPTRVTGNGPAVLLGGQQYNAFDSFEDLRTYMISRREADGSNYTILFNLMKDDNLGLATITHYVPDPQTGEGKLFAFATGTCSATFHPVGHVGATQ